MMEDEDIIRRIRRYRDAYAKKFNYDLNAIFADIQRREKQPPSPLVTPEELERFSAPAADREG